jgi:hypothetical protein
MRKIIERIEPIDIVMIGAICVIIVTGVLAVTELLNGTFRIG